MLSSSGSLGDLPDGGLFDGDLDGGLGFATGASLFFPLPLLAGGLLDGAFDGDVGEGLLPSVDTSKPNISAISAPAQGGHLH